MPDVKISGMSPGSALDGTELLEMTQAGDTYSTTTVEVNYAGASYGDFYSGADQTGNTGTPTAVILGTNAINDKGITVVTDGSNLTRVTVAEAGDYQITYMLQFGNSDAADHNVSSWLRVNGSDVVSTGSVRSVPKAADGGSLSNTQTTIESLTAGQYVQVMWLPSNVAVTLNYTAAAVGPPAVPLIPSAHVVVVRVGL